ncbi:MAG: hypothetical protein ABS81_18370 [Pseudonocardia sp. SCN 72-86]|nr:MAG: hypothetical protein ABS81_18370 [Pseudonocardia sp. SCN 72-86]
MTPATSRTWSTWSATRATVTVGRGFVASQAVNAGCSCPSPVNAAATASALSPGRGARGRSHNGSVMPSRARSAPAARPRSVIAGDTK